MRTITTHCPRCGTPLRVRADAPTQCVHMRRCGRCETTWHAVVSPERSDGQRVIDFYTDRNWALLRRCMVASTYHRGRGGHDAVREGLA